MSSPLGLTFNSLTSNSWNGTKENSNYKVIDNKNVSSLFGNAQFSPFPEAGGVDAASGNVTRISKGNSVHSDDSYDISISEIIKYTSDKPSMKLKPADFAYLKNLGVYPNNRLVIARRFPGPVGNDLTSIQSVPMATLICWVKDNTDYISIQYNEEWQVAEASFKDVLNNIGEDVKASKDNNMGNLGGAAASGFNAIPFPGFMEGIQYQVMKEMGLTDAGIGNSPLGNPNLIRQAKRRSTVSKEEAGSGLSAKFTVKMEVEYEQKFINGVDPTLVYLDIIQNALTFGTSDAAFQFSAAFATGTSNIIGKLISGDLTAIAQALTEFVSKLFNAIKKIGEDIIKALVDPPKDDGKVSASTIFDAVQKAFSSTIGHVVSKYKLRLMGIANALTGSPSTPWHVTIGNPKKPIFSSGDMLCQEVTLTLGKTLAFNDLPSSIKIEFSLTNARPLGADEIFNRLNTGRGRSYKRLQQSFVEAPDRGTEPDTQKQTTNANPVAIVTPFGTVTQETPAGKQVLEPKDDENNDGIDDKYQMTREQAAKYNGEDSYISNSSNLSDWMSGDSPNPPPNTETKPVDVGNSQKTDTGNVNAPGSIPETKPSVQSQSTQPGAVAPVPPQLTLSPTVPGSSSLSDSQVSNADDSLLTARSSKVDEELANTPPLLDNTYTDSKGVSSTYQTINPKYEMLQNEKENIKSEQEDRAEDAKLGITGNVKSKDENGNPVANS
jgi:hypothetical protein